MWDQDDPYAFYMAEEIDPPMHGWKTIRADFDAWLKSRPQARLQARSPARLVRTQPAPAGAENTR